VGREDEARILEALLISAPFPMTKAEIIHYVRASKASETILELLGRLPSRCYCSKNELVNEYFLKSLASRTKSLPVNQMWNLVRLRSQSRYYS
jgi:hypothetical protein